MEKKEYFVSDSLEVIIQKASDTEKQFLAQALNHYENEYHKALKEDNAESVARNFQQHVDNLIRESTVPEGEKISCKKGCSSCCMLHVDIMEEEAELILTHCKEKNIDIDWERLQEQQHYGSETFLSLPAETRKCVFLSEEGTCKIYDIRPINCRKLYSLDDPKKCDLNNGKQAVKRFVCIPAEIVGSALPKGGSLSKMLLKHKKDI